MSNSKDYLPKKIAKINLLSYSINPIFKDNYEKVEEGHKKKCYKCINIVRYALMVNVFLFFFFFYLNKTLNVFFIIIFTLFLFPITIGLNIPLFFQNVKISKLKNISNSENKLKDDIKLDHPIMVSEIRFIFDLLFFLISLILSIVFILFNEQNDNLEVFNKFSIYKKEKEIDNQLMPNLCSVNIYNMPLYLYMFFINDAYYYNEKDNQSSFYYDDYRKLYFDETYKIEVKGNLIKDENKLGKVKMIQYNIKNLNLTILSIKGTTNKRDIYLDVQLYLPSVFLNLLSYFSAFGMDLESISTKIVEYSLSIPYRFISNYLFIKDYINDLMNATDTKETKTKFEKNVVIVGHSLGGGLSKILAKIRKKQAISLSGPGINAFNSRWTKEGNSENFDLSLIDLVPDMDLVPRVEVSGGTIYRIICKEGPFKCHNKAVSLCEVLIMCRHPAQKAYCMEMAGFSSEKIDEIKKLSELNKKLNEIE